MNYNNVSEIKISSKYLPFIFIIFATLLNGFFNSIAVELSLPFPYRTFLFSPDDFMADLIKSALSFPGQEIVGFRKWNELYQNYLLENPFKQEISLNSAELTNLHGTPLMINFFIFARFLLTKLSMTQFLIFFQSLWLIPFGLIIAAYLKSLRLSLALILTSLLTYPVLFAMTRGHIPAGIVGFCLVCVLIAVFEKSWPVVIILLLSLAINIRPNAVIFTIAPFLTWSPREAFKISLATAVVTGLSFIFLFLSAHYLYPNYTPENFLKALSIYHERYVIGDDGLYYGSSLLGMLKLLEKLSGELFNTATAEKLVLIMGICSAIYWTYLAVINRLNKFDGLFFLAAIYATATSVFGDYHLLVFLAFILIYARELLALNYQLEDIDPIILLCVCLVLIPKNYVFIDGFSLQIIINPLILLTGIIWVSLKPARGVGI